MGPKLKKTEKVQNTDTQDDISDPKDGINRDKKEVEFSNDEKLDKINFRLIVGSYEHNLLCLSLVFHKGNPVFYPVFHFQAHSLSIGSIDIAQRYLVTGSKDEHIKIYDLQKRKELGELLSHLGTITKLEFSREHLGDEKTTKTGKWLLSASEDCTIIIWRTKDWEIFATLKGHKGPITDFSIHDSGKVAISVSLDYTIILWNLMTARKAAVLKIDKKESKGQYGEFIRWSHNGDYFVVGMASQVLLYHTESAKVVANIKFKSALTACEVLLIEEREWLVTGNGNGSINFFDLAQGIRSDTDSENKEAHKVEIVEPNFTLMGHSSRVKGLAFYLHQSLPRNTPLLVSISSDGNIVVWDLSVDVKDQIAVYNCGERLNCVVTCPESIEKASTMKRIHVKDSDAEDFTESEYETDSEEIKKFQSNQRTKKGRKEKKNKKPKVSVNLE